MALRKADLWGPNYTLCPQKRDRQRQCRPALEWELASLELCLRSPRSGLLPGPWDCPLIFGDSNHASLWVEPVQVLRGSLPGHSLWGSPGCSSGALESCDAPSEPPFPLPPLSLDMLLPVSLLPLRPARSDNTITPALCVFLNILVTFYSYKLKNRQHELQTILYLTRYI